MTVMTTAAKKSWTGNGTTGPFSFDFPYQDAAHLSYFRKDVNGNVNTETGVTLTPVDGGANGGLLTLSTALAIGEFLYCFRTVPYKQDSDFRNRGGYVAENHESAYDYQMMATQQLVEGNERAIKIPSTDTTGTTVTLPGAASRANMALVFDASGNASVGALPSVTIPSFAGQAYKHLRVNSLGTAYELSSDLIATSVNVKGFSGLGTDIATTRLVAISSQYATLTGTDQYGVVITPTFNSSATSAGRVLMVQAVTADAVFTCPFVAGLQIANASKGASSTITTQYGLYIEDQTRGVSNHGIFVAGSCPSTFIGSIAIGASGTAGMQKLEVHGSGVPRIWVKETGSANIGQFDVSSSTVSFGSYTSTPVIFVIGDAEKTRIDSAGVWYFNATSFANNATVNMAARPGYGFTLTVQANNGATGYVVTNISGTAAYSAMAFYNNGTSYSGCGNISISGTTTTYNTTSDPRLKVLFDIEKPALSTLLKIPVHSGYWKIDENKTRFLMFNAAEVKAAMPECVIGNENAIERDEDGNPILDDNGNVKIIPMMIDYSKFAPLFVQSIRELHEKIVALEAQVLSLQQPLT